MANLVFRTKKLGRYGEVDLVKNGFDLLTLAPGQTTSGCLEIVSQGGQVPNGVGEQLTIEPPGLVKVEVKRRSPVQAEVTITAGHGPGRGWICGPEDLTCSIDVGVHSSHFGRGAVDLVANASNGTDARKIVALQNLLQNESACIMDQFSGPYGDLNALSCGTTVELAGKALFGAVSTELHSYHRPLPLSPKSLAWDDIRYDAPRMEKGIAAIKAKLAVGAAVLVGTTYNPQPGMIGPNHALQRERKGGHSILIVACAGDEFLYLDPYPTGSVLAYQGGFAFNRKSNCQYMGVLRKVTDRGVHLEARTASGFFKHLEVISGPL